MTAPTQGHVPPSAKDFLMGGAKTPAISWKGKPIGTSIFGTVAREPKTIQQTDPEDMSPVFWDEAKTRPKWQLVVPMMLEPRLIHEDTSLFPDHDGVWNWYVRGASAEKELREAVRRSGDAEVTIGAKIRVTLSGHGEQKIRAHNPPNLFTVEYTKAPGDSAAWLAQDAQPTADAMRTQAAQAPPPPPGIDPVAWAGMTPERRGAVLAAMGIESDDTPPF